MTSLQDKGEVFEGEGEGLLVHRALFNEYVNLICICM